MDRVHITVKRDGDTDLVFEGRMIGFGSEVLSVGRSLSITVYVTAGGRFVVSLVRGTSWQDEHDSFRGTVCSAAADVVSWLREEGGGKLSRAAKDALQDAASRDEHIAAAMVERVD